MKFVSKLHELEYDNVEDLRPVVFELFCNSQGVWYLIQNMDEGTETN